MNRYAVISQGANMTALKKAFEKAYQLGEGHVCILTSSFDQFKGSIIAEYLGKKVVNGLVKRKTVDNDEINFSLYSYRTVRNSDIKGTVLALWGQPDKIESLLSGCGTINNIVWLSWSAELGDSWANKHGAEVVFRHDKKMV